MQNLYFRCNFLILTARAETKMDSWWGFICSQQLSATIGFKEWSVKNRPESVIDDVTKKVVSDYFDIYHPQRDHFQKNQDFRKTKRQLTFVFTAQNVGQRNLSPKLCKSRNSRLMFEFLDLWKRGEYLFCKYIIFLPRLARAQIVPKIEPEYFEQSLSPPQRSVSNRQGCQT